MGKNKGTYTVLKRKNKFVISYIEDAEVLYLDRYTFERLEDAQDYLNKNKAEIIFCVSEMKEAEQKKIEEQEAAKKVKEEEKAKKKEERKKKKEERQAKRKVFFANGLVRFICGFLAAVITLVGGHFLAAGIAKLRKEKEVNKQEDAYEETYEEETKLEVEETTNDINISQDIDNIVVKDETLNQENFENLVADFSKQFIDNNINVSTEDLVKFVSIVNIDKLSEENPELASQLFGTQTKEVYLSDAANVVGMVYTYNRNVFEEEKSTENFIRISDSVSGDEKAKLQVIESYVDDIAKVRYNAENVNELVENLINDLGTPTSEISSLDNGTGFGMQVCIELIRSYFAKDTLNSRNYQRLTALSSAEEYVSNIFTIYDTCMSSSKTLTKGK